ncbi:hypothetical protein [Profundibacter sp.]
MPLFIPQAGHGPRLGNGTLRLLPADRGHHPWPDTITLIVLTILVSTGIGSAVVKR